MTPPYAYPSKETDIISPVAYLILNSICNYANAFEVCMIHVTRFSALCFWCRLSMVALYSFLATLGILHTRRERSRIATLPNIRTSYLLFMSRNTRAILFIMLTFQRSHLTFQTSDWLSLSQRIGSSRRKEQMSIGYSVSHQTA